MDTAKQDVQPIFAVPEKTGLSVRKGKDIEFDADLEDAAYTQADPGLLELVWTNLLSNAVKFTP